VHYWRIAYTSAKEVGSHLRLLAGAGVVHRTAAGDCRCPPARALDAAAAFRGSHPLEFRMNPKISQGNRFLGGIRI